MCGIHGIVNKSSFARVSYTNYMKDGFVAGSLRGMDSSGIFQVDKKGAPFVLKLAVPGPQFIDSKVTDQFLRDASGSPLTLAHVRAATMGKVTADNAHPFTAFKENGKRIVGVHNGTLQGWSYKKDGHRYDVDSEWALNQIALKGKEAFELFQGAWAFVWWDEETPDKLFVARNSERPLHFLMTKDESAMLFASEAGMLGWLVERNKVETEDKMYLFETGKLYTIDFSQQKITWSKEDYPAYKTHTYTPVGTSYGGNRRWNAQHARYEHEYEGDVYGDGMMGVMGNSPRTYPTGYELGKNKGGKATDLPEDGRILIEGVKAALADNRDARFQRGKYSKANTTEIGNGVSVVSSEVKPDGKKVLHLPAEKEEGQSNPEDGIRSDDFTCRTDWYSDSSATTQERNAAKSAGLMGELQCFTSLGLYEPETGEALGQIEDYIVGQGKVKYDAIIRGMTAHAAKNLENKSNGTWVAVIGMTEDKHGRYYIVTPINETGLKVLNKRAA